MKHLYIKLTSALIVVTLLGHSYNAVAGNGNRIGSSGASELLINPWARSSGLCGANSANGTPVESMFLNVAGMAFVSGTDIQFTHTDWLSQAGISINAIGLAQRVGSSSVIGFSVNAYNFGDIKRRTTDQPEGDGSFFSPNVVNFGLAYAKAFSNSIYGGFNFHVVSESITDLHSTGIALDAGIRYVTGEKDRIKIGIALKNVGPPIATKGDGLSLQVAVPPQTSPMTVEMRSASYELPSLVSIGGSYDVFLNDKNTLTPCITFISNSFTSDEYIGGLEYNYNKLFYLRAGYDVRRSELNTAGTVETALSGFSAGASIDLPLGKGKNRVTIDYSYRSTNPFNGIQSIGARVYLGKPGSDSKSASN